MRELQTPVEVVSCECPNCRKQFEGIVLPDFEYGKRMGQSLSGKYVALVDGFEDPTLDEVGQIVRQYVDAQDWRLAAEAFDRVYGYACDPAPDGTLYTFAAPGPICPDCQSQSVSCVATNGRMEDVHVVTHSAWEALNPEERIAVVRSALGKGQL